MRASSKIALALLASAALASAAAAQDGGRPFTVTLTGQAELTGGATQADTNGSGTARVTINPGQQRVCWDIDVANLDPLTAAHIHRGGTTQTGAPVVAFFNPGQPVVLDGCTTARVDRALLMELIQNPQRFYVNVHTAVYPGGAIRGQLGK